VSKQKSFGRNHSADAVARTFGYEMTTIKENLQERYEHYEGVNEESLDKTIDTLPGERWRLPANKAEPRMAQQHQDMSSFIIVGTIDYMSHRHRDAAGSFTCIIVHSGHQLWVLRHGPNDTANHWMFLNSTVETFCKCLDLGFTDTCG
jgi:hypothetical protein